MKKAFILWVGDDAYSIFDMCILLIVPSYYWAAEGGRCDGRDKIYIPETGPQEYILID